mgnify:FL=1
MKIQRQFPWKELIKWGSAVLACLGVAYLLYLNNQYEKKPVDNTPGQIQEKPATESAPAPAPKEVQVALPGASPIPARQEDYQADGSIWQIVNQTRGFKQPTYVPSDLQTADVPTLPGRGPEERSLRAAIMPDLKALMAAAESAGSPVRLGSGYRSYQTQVGLFNRYARQVGEAQAARFSARPGYSEHQSGLALDFGSPDGKCWVDDCFKNTKAGKWLAAHAHEYGFILRYPEGKQSIVGYQYEAWHFRYVGRELAGALHQSGLTLEEALPYLEKAQNELKQKETSS